MMDCLTSGSLDLALCHFADYWLLEKKEHPDWSTALLSWALNKNFWGVSPLHLGGGPLPCILLL
jgi:hypothetical protein